MSRRLVGAVLLVAAGLAQSAAAQAPVEWKLKVGDKFYLRTVTTTKQTLKALNKDVPQNAEQTVVLGFSVEEKVGDNFLLKETIEDVTVKSDKGDAVSDPKIAGSVFLLTVSPKWEILKFEGYDKLVDRLAGDDPAVRQALTATLPEDVFKRTVREAMAFLPDRPVKDGETWERSVESPLGPIGTLRETRTYKMEGKEDVGGKKVDKITYTTAVEFKPGKKVENLPYYVISGQMEVKEGKGTVHFDPAASQLVQIKSDLKLVGRMVLSISETKVDAVVEQEQGTVVTVLKEKPGKK
ncbi:MAG TPA: DUF6263 family protein [Gemmataceae bacterium]|nr:DUF6263 family protein [Gemmataceae bacterium]